MDEPPAKQQEPGHTLPDMDCQQRWDLTFVDAALEERFWNSDATVGALLQLDKVVVPLSVVVNLSMLKLAAPLGDLPTPYAVQKTVWFLVATSIVQRLIMFFEGGFYRRYRSGIMAFNRVIRIVAIGYVFAFSARWKESMFEYMTGVTGLTEHEQLSGIAGLDTTPTMLKLGLTGTCAGMFFLHSQNFPMQFRMNLLFQACCFLVSVLWTTPVTLDYLQWAGTDRAQRTICRLLRALSVTSASDWLQPDSTDCGPSACATLVLFVQTFVLLVLPLALLYAGEHALRLRYLRRQGLQGARVSWVRYAFWLQAAYVCCWELSAAWAEDVARWTRHAWTASV